jgi:hypothetical protein
LKTSPDYQRTVATLADRAKPNKHLMIKGEGAIQGGFGRFPGSASGDVAVLRFYVEGVARRRADAR